MHRCITPGVRICFSKLYVKLNAVIARNKLQYMLMNQKCRQSLTASYDHYDDKQYKPPDT